MTSGNTYMLIICSIIARNRLAHARVLMESVARWQPDAERVVLLVDEIEGCFDPAAEPFRLIHARDLRIPGWSSVAMRCDRDELCDVVKPFLLEYLFETTPADRVVYLDACVLVTAPLEPMITPPEDSMALVVPHLLNSGAEHGLHPERDLLLSGVFSPAFFALARRGNWRELLRWWSVRLLSQLRADSTVTWIPGHRWLELAIPLFAGITILRHPGANIARWNLHERTLESVGEHLHVNGVQALYLDFSRPDSLEPDATETNPAFERALYTYEQQLKVHGQAVAVLLPWAYGHYPDGVTITPAERACLRRFDPDGERWPDPFDIASHDSFRFWCQSVPEGDGHLLSPYARMFHELHPELQRAFPEIDGPDQTAFARWFASCEYASHEYAPRFTQPVAKRLPPPDDPVQTHPSRAERLLHAIEYWRLFPTRIAPTLPAEVLTGRTPPRTGGIQSLVSAVRRAVRRVIGVRLILAYHHYRSLSPPPAATPASESLPPTVNVIGFAHSIKGIGEAMRSTLRSLEAVDRPHQRIAIRIDGQRHWTLEGDANTRGDGINIFHVNADGTFAIRSFLREQVRFSGWNIGFWFWELETWPQHWQHHFAACDEIWVASAFIESTLAAISPVPVTRIPLAIELAPPAAIDRAALNLPTDAFCFLFMFDMDSVIERKNPWAVIEAYQRAFSEAERSENVRLVIKVINLDPESVQGARLIAVAAAVDAIVMTAAVPKADIIALIAACDAYVSLHRSEGFGLTIAEAMALGKPVIATGYSGNLEFMTEDTSLIVPFERVPIGTYAHPYPIGAFWAEPDTEAAARLMRWVFDHPDEARAIGQRAATHIRDHFSPAVVGQRMAQRLAEIESELAKRR